MQGTRPFTFVPFNESYVVQLTGVCLVFSGSDDPFLFTTAQIPLDALVGGQLFLLYVLQAGIYPYTGFHHCDRLFCGDLDRAGTGQAEEEISVDTEYRRQCRGAGRFQVLEFHFDQPERRFSGGPSGQSDTAATYPVADRAQLSHFSGHELYDRDLPGASAAGKAFRHLCPVCDVLSATGSRADRKAPEYPAPVP